MLDWLTTEQQSHYAEDSRLLDGPETPAPVFALRAFKSLFQGSPSKEDQTLLPQESHTRSSNRQNVDDNRTSRLRSLPETSPSKPSKRPSLESLTRSPTKMGGSDSPMKSILLSSPRKMATPGTKKKNVSFREALHATKGRTNNPAALKNGEVSSLRKSTKARSSLDVMDDAEQNPSKNEEKDIKLNKRDAPKSDTTKPRESQMTSEPQLKSCRSQSSQSSGADENVPILPSKSDLDDLDKGLSLTAPIANFPSQETGVPSPEDVSDYMSRTNREVRKLVKVIKTTRSFARKKDQEATELSAKLAKKSAQNQRLHAENKEMKEKLKTLEEKLAQMQEHGSVRNESAVPKEKAIEVELHEETRQITTPSLPEPSNEGALQRHVSAPGLIFSVPKQREGDTVSRESSNMNELQQDSRNGTPPMRLSSANARIRMAPERLEAAKARLRVKSEERKKAVGSSPADKENA
ncbi:MAG: hypothetical protein Q9160_007647 [Pyrenula sp. 1 TL-2023]